jgi:hypothetical protein
MHCFQELACIDHQLTKFDQHESYYKYSELEHSPSTVYSFEDNLKQRENEIKKNNTTDEESTKGPPSSIIQQTKLEYSNRACRKRKSV